MHRTLCRTNQNNEGWKRPSARDADSASYCYDDCQSSNCHGWPGWRWHNELCPIYRWWSATLPRVVIAFWVSTKNELKVRLVSIFVGELLKQAERYTSEGLHPRLITEGYEIAKDMALEFLDAFKVAQPKIFQDRELLTNVVRTSLRTKLAAESADKMSDAIVDAMLAISEEGQPIDLHMVEVMQVIAALRNTARLLEILSAHLTNFNQYHIVLNRCSTKVALTHVLLTASWWITVLVTLTCPATWRMFTF